jgi:hypothetical protein
MPLITWQLWRAKDIVQENHLPWQKPQKNLSPARVAQSNVWNFSGNWNTS